MEERESTASSSTGDEERVIILYCELVYYHIIAAN